MTQQGFGAGDTHLVHLPHKIYGCRFRLGAPVVYTDSTMRAGKAPTDMLLDGRSGPHVFYPPVDTDFLPCYADHDHGCSVARMLPPGEARNTARLYADWRLQDSMLWIMEHDRHKVNRAKVWAVYRGVRIGAWWARNRPTWQHYPLWTPDMTTDWTPLEGDAP